jgi:3',5'-cyclic AMP phosphodiesterase CpdA
MRFAAIADVHGNYLALEAVVADIRAQNIDEIVNLGDMASGPLDARRTMDALMALDAVHVLGNHDRYLIDRPAEKMGSWDRPAHAQLDATHLDWLRAVPPTCVFRDQVFLCHATPDSDEVYWLETVLPDGTARMSSREEIEKAAEGITQRLILCGHTHMFVRIRMSSRPARRTRATRSWNFPMASGARRSGMCPTITMRWPHWRAATVSLNWRRRWRQGGFVRVKNANGRHFAGRFRE